MKTKTLDRILGWLALLATLVVVAMVAGIVLTHSSQDYFQKARPTADFQQYLAVNPLGAIGLRLNIGLDDAFIVLYATFFTILAARLRFWLDRWIVAVALGAMLIAALLDIAENQHSIVMLHSLEHGLALNLDGAQAQAVATNIKFHLTFVSILLFSFGYAKLGGLGKAIAGLLGLGYLPFGILLLAYPVDGVGAGTLALARTAFFVVAFLLSAILFWRQSRLSVDGQPVDPDAGEQ